MATLKIALPVGAKDSKASKDALKVCLTVAAYDSQVLLSKGTKSPIVNSSLIAATDGKVTLENRKQKLVLNDANAIVTYVFIVLALIKVYL